MTEKCGEHARHQFAPGLRGDFTVRADLIRTPDEKTWRIKSLDFWRDDINARNWMTCFAEDLAAR